MVGTCAYCGKQFEVKNIRHIYCSDLCRQHACRERKREQPKKLTEYKMHRIEIEEAIKRNREEERKKLEACDALARMAFYGSKGRNSAEYWTAFQQYDREFSREHGDRFISFVNGIRTDHPQFVEAVMVSIEEERTVYIRTEDIKQKGNRNND